VSFRGRFPRSLTPTPGFPIVEGAGDAELVRMSQHRIALIEVLLALVLAPLSLCAQETSLAGRWTGFGDVIVTWTRARTIIADIVIADDGTVSGTVGDAKLLEARLKKNHGRLASMMGWKTEYIIEAKLDGPILRDEGLVRASVNMPLNLDAGRLQGSVATNGKPYGGFEKESFVAKVTLSRKTP
jgi:hypothetical protein